MYTPSNTNDNTSSCSDSDSVQDWLQDPDADCEADRRDELLRLHTRNEPIPRKLRTHNLFLTKDWCTHWGPEDGIRELIQNFFDGICTAFSVKLDKVTFLHRVQGGPDKRNWKEIWIAKSDSVSKQATEYGRLTYDRKKNSLCIVNEGVKLSQNVLLHGKTDKRNRSDLIGGYGEGMKIGILRLVSYGCDVRYRTGSEIWKFGIRKSRGSDEATLHYITSKSQSSRTNLEVLIRNIEDDYFELESFLPLSRDSQKPVKGSVCTVGYLLEAPVKKELAANRVFVKGLYVHSNPELRVSVNFARAGVNRDRNIRMVDRELKKILAQIWSTVFESEKSLMERPYTAMYLDIANTDTSSVEFQCLTYMGYHAAECLYNEILRQKVEAFPYKRGAEEEEKLISSSLKKQPYPVHENLLQLLNKLPEVMTVYAAQEKAFLVNCSESAASVYELPIARMIKEYVSKILGDVNPTSVRFRNPETNDIDALLKEKTLICHQFLVDVPYENEKQAIRAKLTALRAVERELRKCRASDSNRVFLETMEYVASAEFQSYLLPNPLPLRESPVTVESGSCDDIRASPNRENAHSPRIGSKRTRPELREESQNFQEATTVNHQAQRMRFTVGGYEVQLSHKLSSTTHYALEQTFGDSSATIGGGTREISLNLGNVLPCCRTNNGDLVFTTVIRKQDL